MADAPAHAAQSCASQPWAAPLRAAPLQSALRSRLVRTSASRSEAAVASILEEFERRRDVFRLTVDGVSLWRLLRFEISFTIQNLGLVRPSISIGETRCSAPPKLWIAFR